MATEKKSLVFVVISFVPILRYEAIPAYAWLSPNVLPVIVKAYSVKKWLNGISTSLTKKNYIIAQKIAKEETYFYPRQWKCHL